MKRNPTRLALASVGTAVLLAGCAQGSVSGGTEPVAKAGSGLKQATIGLFPSSAVGAIQLGIDKGFFSDAGIDLKVVLGQGSAAQLPALSSGTMQFVLSSPTTPLVATTKGLDVEIVSGYARNRPQTVSDSVAVLVSKGSTIKSAKDLEGKKVSINALGSIGEIGIKEAVEKDGGDPSKVTFVQLGFDQVPAQLASGRIDAGMAGPPFMQQVEASGGKVVSDFINAAGLGGAELVIVSSGKLTKSDPELVKSFNAALKKTLTYSEGHQDEVRAELPKVLGTDPKIAAKTQFIEYNADLDVAAIDQFAELMAKFKIVDKKPDVSKAVWKP